MTLRSRFSQVDRSIKHNIVWIEDDCDANGDAKMSVTNDAENVLAYFRSIYGNRVRVVYRDTEMEWWEIVPDQKTWMGTGVGFKPWNGLEWDILSRQEN